MLLTVLASLTATRATQASTYLEIPTIDGEQSTPGHADVIRLDSYSLGDNEFTIVKLTDSTTPDLLSAAASGTVFPTASLLFYPSDVPAGPPESTLVFQSVLVSSFQLFNVGQNSFDQVTFSYQSVPEPSAAFLPAMATIAALLRRRRRPRGPAEQDNCAPAGRIGPVEPSKLTGAPPIVARTGVACLLGLFLAASAVAAPSDYTFINIADTAESFTGVSTAHAINNAGTVAFAAGAGGGNAGIFTGSGGGSTTTIADLNGPYNAFGQFTSINDTGTVAFVATLDAGGGGIFTSTGGSVTPIADLTGPFSGLGQIVSIDAAGNVAFNAALHSGGDGIFTANGGPVVTTIAHVSGPYSGFSIADVNASGTVAFAALLDAGGEGIFIGNGDATTTIADTAGPFQAFVTGNAPSLNITGVAVFHAMLDAGGEGIFTGSGGATSTIADTSGPFSGFGGPGGAFPAISADGTVAFLATLDAGGTGIFTGDDPVADRVIGTGDPLFGSTVTQLYFFRSLSDDGDISFRYVLASGIEGIAVAAVPEPGSFSLIAVAAISLATGRRRRRSHPACRREPATRSAPNSLP